MKKGTLVQYFSLDEEVVYGIITKFIEYHRGLKGSAVEVVWFDDLMPTTEATRAFCTPENEDGYIEVVSESR